MRTTISIEAGLLDRARKVAHETGTTLGQVIENALRVTLAARSKQSSAEVVRPVKTFRGSGTLPGVDLNSSSGLLEIMEGR